MELFIAGLVLFFGIHLVPTAPALKARLVTRLGRNGYRGAFALVSVVAFIMIVAGYARADFVPLWPPPVGLRPVVPALMLVAFVLLAAAYLPNNLRRVVPHPMLAAVVLWALAHFIVRGDLAAVLLFGSFLVYSGFDWWSANRRGDRKPARRHARWRDVLVVAIGIFLYLGAIHFHPSVIGVPVW